MLAGCAEQIQVQKQEPLRLFNREYYSVKNLNADDIAKLNSLNKGEGQSAAKAAGLILGRHYVRNGETDRGYDLLKENLDENYLDRYMKISGHLWLYDAAVKKGDEKTAEKEKGYLSAIEIDEKTEKIIRHYCAQEGRESGSDVKSCLFASEAPAVQIEIETERIPDEETVTKSVPHKKIIVNVKSADKDPELVEAMLYATSKLGADIELDFSNSRSDYDYTVDAQSKIVTSHRELIEFGINMERVFEEAVNFALLNGNMILAVGYNKALYENAQKIAEKYKNSDVQVYTFDITDQNFQSTLSTIKEKSGEDRTISFVIAGSEREIVKVVPFLRYYSDKPDKTMIVCAVDGFGKLFFNTEYIEYFKKTYVLSEIMLIGNSSVERYNENYFNDYTKLPTVKDMLGHDIIVFMQKMKNPGIMQDYLTGISRLEEGKTVRNVEAYQIIREDKVLKLIN
jgi:hypothetical protein